MLLNLVQETINSRGKRRVISRGKNTRSEHILSDAHANLEIERRDNENCTHQCKIVRNEFSRIGRGASSSMKCGHDAHNLGRHSFRWDARSAVSSRTALCPTLITPNSAKIMTINGLTGRHISLAPPLIIIERAYRRYPLRHVCRHVCVVR